MRHFAISAFLCLVTTLSAQQRPSPIYIGSDAPTWMSLMQADAPNVHDIQAAYQVYYESHPFQKNAYTQYFKRWMHWARSYALPDGSLHIPTVAEITAQENTLHAARMQVQNRDDNAGEWTFLGPQQTFDVDGTTEVTWQTNIYSLDVAPSNTSVLYAGGESGGLWRTTDKGLHWNLLTQNVLHGAFGAVKIHPTDPNTAYAATDGKIIKTTDGGSTWAAVYTENNLWVNEMAIKADDPNIVLAATDQGLLRSTDGGAVWTKLYPQQFWTVKSKPGTPGTFFAVRKNGAGSDFMRSTDGGAIFAVSNSGWWIPGQNESVTGAIIAVCPSNASKLYAYLCGSGANLYGYVGVFVSTNNGTTWTNTQPQNAIGNSPTVYAIPNHTNLMYSDGAANGFDQGFYDMAIVVNPLNENELIAGGTSWFKSVNGGQTWSALGSYVGGLEWSHPDMQALVATGNDLWIATDGGLNYSTNFAASIIARMNGISGADLWGFDSGWNEDVLVGGRYHNGNMAWHESFPAGKYFRMGGAESPTGYVNPGEARKTYFSDIGGKKLLGGFLDGIADFPIGMSPNESYAYYANSEMVWDPRCWNIVYLGYENKIWKSTDGGTSYNVLYAFPGTATNTVYEIEIARADPQVIYCSQWDGTDDRMWRSANGGQTWTQLSSLPLPNNNDRVKMAVSAEDANVLWVAVTYGSNGKKIYKSSNGGSTWINLTTATLNNYRVTNIMAQYGTDGGIYLGTGNGVFYRNNSMADWQLFSAGLPMSAETNRLKPFYKTGKIRNGCWGFGVWESDLFEPSAVIAQPMTSNLTPACARDTVFFDDYSVVNHTGATWSWAFSPAPQFIDNAAIRNPKVVFGASGTYTATMTLNGAYSKSLTITVSDGCQADTIPGLAVTMGGNDAPGYVALPALNLTTNEITITAWVKPDGIQPDYSAIFMHDGETAGFNFRPGNNHLGYHWPGGQWWWDSGLTVPAGQWSYVAMVVTPTGISLYVNGVKATQSFTVAPVSFTGGIRLGNYKGWGDRYMKGGLDEVCIFNASLTQNQIRELMHLTKNPSEIPQLIAYYQFNESQGPALDRVGTRHASLVANATRISATEPVGKGTSNRQTVTAGGSYTFGNTGLTLQFPATGTRPNGELCASYINQAPDQLPSAAPHSRGYWVVNNYGSNPTFTTLTGLQFGNYGPIPAGATAGDFKLYKRSSTAEGFTWGNILDNGDAVQTGTNGRVDFTSGNGVTSFSQFVINYAGVLPVEWLDFVATLEKNKSVRLYWAVNQTNQVAHFTIEKSRDAQSFQAIGEQKARSGDGLFSYEVVDTDPFSGINYYRLRQVDADGSYTYSKIRSIVTDALANTWIVYPNPVQAGGKLTLQTNTTGDYRFRIFDLTGKLLFEQRANGATTITCPNIPAGAYGYEVLGETHRVAGRLLVD